MSPRIRRLCRGFTLVELLVVIGIIALLISILLPSLNKARRSAIAVKCLANERSLGQAFYLYATDNKNAILPCQVWGGGSGAVADPWAFLLIQGHYIPDPRIQGGSVGPASSGSVFVCPAVRDVPAYDGTTSPPFSLTGSCTDGYDRRASGVLMPATSAGPGYTPPEPITNGAQGACIVDIGYGVNGLTGTDAFGGNNYPDGKLLPMQSVSFDAANPHGAVGTLKFSNFAKSSTKTVLLFDGSEWNAFNTTGSPPSGSYIWRVSGSRHGNWINGGVGGKSSYTTGICNVLFVDGHAAAVQRAALPYLSTGLSGAYCYQMIGGPNNILNASNPGVTNAYIWNSSQQ